MIRTIKMAALLALAPMVLFSACGEEGAASSAGNGSAVGGSVEISVVGSTTVQPLAELLSEAYEAVAPNVRITVSGGGSSVGVKSASEGTADIGMASRVIKDSEIADCPEMVIHIIAWDGIAIVTGHDVDVDDLTMEETRSIFSGVITDWSEVGGAPGVITVVSREEGAGTRGAFEEMVLGDALMAAAAILQPSNGAVRTTVTTTPGAIAYLSFGYLDDSCKPIAVDGALPTTDAVRSGAYTVVRPLNLLTNGEPQGAVADWLEFIKGEHGQGIAVSEGYLPIN